MKGHDGLVLQPWTLGLKLLENPFVRSHGIICTCSFGTTTEAAATTTTAAAIPTSHEWFSLKLKFNA